MWYLKRFVNRQYNKNRKRRLLVHCICALAWAWGNICSTLLPHVTAPSICLITVIRAADAVHGTTSSTPVPRTTSRVRRTNLHISFPTTGTALLRPVVVAFDAMTSHTSLTVASETWTALGASSVLAAPAGYGTELCCFIADLRGHAVVFVHSPDASYSSFRPSTPQRWAS